MAAPGILEVGDRLAVRGGVLGFFAILGLLFPSGLLLAPLHRLGLEAGEWSVCLAEPLLRNPAPFLSPALCFVLEWVVCAAAPGEMC